MRCAVMRMLACIAPSLRRCAGQYRQNADLARAQQQVLHPATSNIVSAGRPGDALPWTGQGLRCLFAPIARARPPKWRSVCVPWISAAITSSVSGRWRNASIKRSKTPRSARPVAAGASTACASGCSISSTVGQKRPLASPGGQQLAQAAEITVKSATLSTHLLHERSR